MEENELKATQITLDTTTREVLKRLQEVKPYLYRSNTATISIALHELWNKELSKKKEQEEE